MFFDSFDAADPADILPGAIHIRLGVPSRNGERKTRIVDGPTEVPITWGDVLDESETTITFWPGVFASKLSATLVGYSGHDAFSAVQIYEWAMDGRKPKRWRLGFRDKQEMCLKFGILGRCPCMEDLTDEESKAWIDEMIATGVIAGSGSQEVSGRVDVSTVMVKYPLSQQELANSPERVLYKVMAMRNPADQHRSAWFFFVTNDPAARWLALDGLDQSKGDTAGIASILRGKSCCARCACTEIASKSFVLL
jgi:hypothetical protein